MKIIIATHHILSISFKETLQMIAGEQATKDIMCLCMTEDKDPNAFLEEAQFIVNENPDEKFLIFADLFGASPANTSLMAFRYSNYRLITGVNLPMLLEVLFLKDTLSLEELYIKAQETGKAGIQGICLNV